MVYIPDEAKERIEHVARPGLPWRGSTLTECGKPKANQPCLTREEFFAKLKKEGQQRSAMTTCMTCWDTAQRHRSWEENPLSAIQREIEAISRWGRSGPRKRKDDNVLEMELKGIAILISRHRAEFDELVEDQREIVPLGGRQ